MYDLTSTSSVPKIRQVEYLFKKVSETNAPTMVSKKVEPMRFVRVFAELGISKCISR